jgi:hypothetical protein
MRLTPRIWLVGVTAVWLFAVGAAVGRSRFEDRRQERAKPAAQTATQNAEEKVRQGRRIFRFDTFGDQSFWGGTLQLHQAIEGARFGGVGQGVTPRMALAVGLKIDSAALPDDLVDQIGAGHVNLDDPAVTLALLKLNAVVGLTGEFNPNAGLKSIGIQCALCHSTVDASRPALCSRGALGSQGALGSLAPSEPSEPSEPSAPREPTYLLDQRDKPKSGRRRVPANVPTSAAASHTQPCTLPDAMPPKYAPMLQPNAMRAP